MSIKVFFSVIVFSLFSNNINAVLQIDWDTDKYLFDRQLYEDVLDPDLCHRQLIYLTLDTGLLATFLDAGIRIPRGILLGNTVDLGNFYQCLAINEVAEDMTINGKYCKIRVPVEQNIHLPEFLDRSYMKFDPTELQIDKNTLKKLEAARRQKLVQKSNIAGADFNLRIGPDSPIANINFDLAVCIPKPCTTEQAINGLLFNMTDIGFKFSDVSCRLPNDRPWVAADYIAIVVFSLIGLLTVVSTCYDLYQCYYLKKDSKDISSAYTSFSVYTNGRRLMTFKSNPGSIECLDGIRALSMIWVILGHTFFAISEVINPIETFQWSISARAIWITVAPLAVDTFFLLSGLLLVYTTAGKFGRMQLLKRLHVFYLLRILRMFPVLAAVILFESSIYFRVSDGPLWERVASQVHRCREFWWSTLFHMQNIVNPRDMCVGVAWYLAIDTQLHILSPIILFWVLTSRRAAWNALNISLVATLTASTVFIFFHNFPSGIISPNRPNESVDFLTFYYVNTLTRASPFLVGMIYGYLLHLWRKKKIEFPKVLTTILLLCFLLTKLVVIYCSYIAMTLDWDNQLADNFFNSFLRPLWALAVGWMIFACVEGRAEPINWFLSLHVWKLPARLSYAMYLIHFSFMIVVYATIFSPIYFTVSYTLFYFMAFMLLTMILSFFVTLLIDSPFSTIFKILLDGGTNKPQKSNRSMTDSVTAVNINVNNDDNLATDEDNKKEQPFNELAENGDMKLNINGGVNTLLTGKQ